MKLRTTKLTFTRTYEHIEDPEVFFSLTRERDLKTDEIIGMYKDSPCMVWIRGSNYVRFNGKHVHVRRVAAYHGRPHLTNRPPRTPYALEKQNSLKVKPVLRYRLIKSINSPLRVYTHCSTPLCVNPWHLYATDKHGPVATPRVRKKREIKAQPARERTLVHMIPPLPTLPISYNSHVPSTSKLDL
jgi:hypothetical protein